jgi:hypothetical protein
MLASQYLQHGVCGDGGAVGKLPLAASLRCRRRLRAEMDGRTAFGEASKGIRTGINGQSREEPVVGMD